MKPGGSLGEVTSAAIILPGTPTPEGAGGIIIGFIIGVGAAAILGIVIAIASVPLLGFDLAYDNTESVKIAPWLLLSVVQQERLGVIQKTDPASAPATSPGVQAHAVPPNGLGCGSPVEKI